MDVQYFFERGAFAEVLQQQGRVQLDADFNELEAGAAVGAEPLGGLRFRTVTDSSVGLLVGTGIVSGLGIGAAPDGVFHGDQGAQINVTPGQALTAFGVLITVDSDVPLSDGVFGLSIRCLQEPCVSIINSANAPLVNRTLFLGIIAPRNQLFDGVVVQAITPRDANGASVMAVPRWQLTALTYAEVPLPDTSLLVYLGLGLMILLRKMRTSTTER